MRTLQVCAAAFAALVLISGTTMAASNPKTANSSAGCKADGSCCSNGTCTATKKTGGCHCHDKKGTKAAPKHAHPKHTAHTPPAPPSN